MTEEIIASITFKGFDILKVAKFSKRHMRLVHDDGTYIIPDVTNRPLIRPTSGALPGGEGDDFVESVPLPKSSNISSARFILTENTLTTEYNYFEVKPQK